MKNYFLIFPLFLFLFFSCDVGDKNSSTQNNSNNINNTNNNNGDITVLKSNEPRNESPAPEDTTLSNTVSSINEFSFDLYNKIIEESDGNIIYSPWSITTALSMTWAGAAGNTETEMANTLHFNASQNIIHQAINYLDLHLNSLGTSGTGQNFILSSVNSIWGEKTYSFESPFLDILAINYGAGLNLMDFIGNPAGSRNTINQWVSSKTDGKIDDLIPPDAIDQLTRMVLVNALYFKAGWLSQFAPDATYSGDFITNTGTVTSGFMTQDASLIPYYEGTGYKAVSLPYIGEAVSMVVIMPDAGTFNTFETTIDSSLLNTITQDATIVSHLILTMPKFNFEYPVNLVNPLKALGIIDAFDLNSADFTNMHKPQELYISNVIHKAFISIDEAGTEAGAATAVIMSGFGDSTIFTVDHPFLFYIRDNDTGLILFAGRVVDPS